MYAVLIYFVFVFFISQAKLNKMKNLKTLAFQIFTVMYITIVMIQIA